MNDGLGFYLAAFCLSPVAVIVCQMVLNRALSDQSAQKLTMHSMALGYGVFFGFMALLPSTDTRGLEFYLYLFLLYSFAAYTYFHVFNMSETSRRIRMLRKIGTTPNADLNSLKDLYNAEDMVNVRLDRLVALGQIRRSDSIYYPKGRLFPVTASVLYAVSLAVDRPWPELRSFIESTKNDSTARS